MYKAVFLICSIGLIAHTCNASPFEQQQIRHRRQADKPSNGEKVNDGNFGAGAAAGIGGLGRSAGIGSLSSDSNTNNPSFNPFGAYAGLNLGQGAGEKVGAGCSGLNCGFQLGNLALSTRQLLEAFTNGNGNGRRQNIGMGRNTNNYYPNNNIDDRDATNYDNTGRYASQYQNPNQAGYNGFRPFTNFNNYGPFTSSSSSGGGGGFDALRYVQQPFKMFQQRYQQFQQQYQQNQRNSNLPSSEGSSSGSGLQQEQQQPPKQPSISEFARFGNNNKEKRGLFSGSAFSSSFGSGNGMPPIFHSTSTHVDQDGKVTMVESGSGMEDKITTGRIGNPGESNGVFAASGTKVDPDGSVSSFRNVGPIQ